MTTEKRPTETKILVVDDEPTARLVCSQVVRAAGYPPTRPPAGRRIATRGAFRVPLGEVLVPAGKT